jgi:DNA-binding transcriptional regulator GbsR (MarR family)
MSSTTYEAFIQKRDSLKELLQCYRTLIESLSAPLDESFYEQIEEISSIQSQMEAIDKTFSMPAGEEYSNSQVKQLAIEILDMLKESQQYVGILERRIQESMEINNTVLHEVMMKKKHISGYAPNLSASPRYIDSKS